MLMEHQTNPDRVLKLSQSVALISFFLLFPGFLFYHQFVAMGLIPPFAAGFFGYVSLGTLLAFLILLPWNTDWLKKIIKNRYALCVMAFLFYTSAWTLAHYMLLEGDYITKASVQSLETVIFWSCLFLIGLLLPLESVSLRWSLCISFAVILVYLLYFFATNDATMYYARRIYGGTADVATYQGFGRSVLFTLLLLLAVSNSFRARAFFMLGGVFVLFMLISRSDFYAFLAVSATLCIISGIKQPKYLLLLLFISMEVAMLAVPDITPRIKVFLETRSPDIAVQAPAPDDPVSPDKATPRPVTGQDDKHLPSAQSAELPRLSRQFEVLDFSSSKSWAGRLALQRKAVRQISENPLIGKFGGHVLTEDAGKHAKGHTGRYAHNALSAWVSYGLVGFLLYIALTLYGFLVSARQVIMKCQDTPLWKFAFMLNFVCLVLIIASKSVFWPLPALGWGILAQALVNPPSDRN